MPIYKMKLCPQQSGYSVTLGYNKIVQQTGFNPRIRQGVKRQGHRVNVSWLTDRYGYDYLNAFYNLWMNGDEDYFLCDLIIDGSDLLEYRCQFLSGIQLSQIQGHAHWVTAEIYVRAKARNQLQDEIIELGALDLINPLEKLVNVDLPNATENLNG